MSDRCLDLDCDVCRQSAEERPPQVPAPIAFGPDRDYDVAKALVAHKRAGGNVVEHSAWVGVKVHSARVLALYARLVRPAVGPE